MLTRITWLLVVVGLGLVIGGFIMEDSNILLILAIAAEVAAIILVLASWAQKAREASSYDDAVIARDDVGQEPADEELYAALEGDDDEFTVGARQTRPARRPARKSTTSRKTSSSKAKPKTTTARKRAAKAKAKPKAKPKAAPKTTASRPKRKPTRRPRASE